MSVGRLSSGHDTTREDVQRQDGEQRKVGDGPRSWVDEGVDRVDERLPVEEDRDEDQADDEWDEGVEPAKAVGVAVRKTVDDADDRRGEEGEAEVVHPGLPTNDGGGGGRMGRAGGSTDHGGRLLKLELVLNRGRLLRSRRDEDSGEDGSRQTDGCDDEKDPAPAGEEEDGAEDEAEDIGDRTRADEAALPAVQRSADACSVDTRLRREATHIEMALDRSLSFGNRLTIKFSAAGIVADAPMPLIARRTMTVVLSWAKPMASEKMATQVKPRTKLSVGGRKVMS